MLVFAALAPYATRAPHLDDVDDDIFLCLCQHHSPNTAKGIAAAKREGGGVRRGGGGGEGGSGGRGK